ncbi:MAG: insulinase family protein [Bacteroidales bacterium]|nr:insulinase family protein [Bacteroidales bacterium]
MTETYIPGTVYHGFILHEKRFVKELNTDCFHFSHVRSGARLLKIVSDDANKTFSIGFKTFPESDNGAPHIMEHSVLNGSKNFPVKSPFDVLLKGSLSTFLNAFTSKDYTMYPVASMNDKDYFNLMHVYLDAVFNPMIYDDSRILMQEGWHFELTAKDEPLKYSGVVYNEMKGSFSNPQRELFYQVFKHLFPDNAYGYESGGTPAAIPALTNEAFLEFHQKNYHPENSYIFLYGNADLEKELEFIDSAYLSNFTKTGNLITVEDQSPFHGMKEITSYYPVMVQSEMLNQTFLTYNFVAGHNTDLALTLALDILCQVLVNQESAPIRLALTEAGIGQDVSASSSNFKQHAVQIAAINANPGDKYKFLEIVTDTLRKVASEGLNKEEIEGVINRIEFRLREGNDAHKGLTYLNMALPTWFFANDPITGLEYDTTLKEVKKALTSDYLETIIRKYFLDNPHSLLLTLEPSTGLEKERNDILEAELLAIRLSMDENATSEMISETQELISFQQREDSPESLASIPMLEISDIDPKAPFYKVSEETHSGIPVLAYEEFTNDVVYVNLFFDLCTVPEELIPYISLLSHVIGTMNTNNYSYGDLNKTLNIHTGGFFTSLRTYLVKSDDNQLLSKFVVTSKAMNHKVGKLFELAEEILNQSIFNDAERLKTVISRHQSQVEAQIKGNGYHVASHRLSSYISNQGMFNELTGGLAYYWFLTDLVKNFDTDSTGIIANLEKVASLLFTRNNMVVSVIGEKKDQAVFGNGLNLLAGKLPVESQQRHEWNFSLDKQNEGLMAASNVQYVVNGYNYKRLGYAWDARMRVLNQILSTDWLQTRIRVIGGAYGGFSSISPGGNFTFNSYRDPNLGSTIENFSNTPSYLSSFDADRQSMTRYIIGTISEMDSPLTPSQKGEQAVSLFFSRRTVEEVQHDRDAVLSATPEDIRGFSQMVMDVLNQKALCVFGNAEKLTRDQPLFNSLVKIDGSDNTARVMAPEVVV